MSRPCVVQFLHPGGEWAPTGPTKPWNEGQHRRSFLEAEAGLLKHVSAPPIAGTARFWGEWEAEAEAHVLAGQRAGMPRAVLAPYYLPKATYRRLQNTDPFVFGDRFLYCCCKQFRGSPPRRTSLADLARGSVLLFGSRLGGHFVLDTVFVVDNFIDYAVDASTLTHAADWNVPHAFIDVTLKPLIGADVVTCDATIDDADMSDEEEETSACVSAGCGVPPELRLYFGATLDHPVEGMFSYAPCRFAAEVPDGFERPVVHGEFVTPTLGQGYRLTDVPTAAAAASAWRAVTEQVLASGLHLGFRFAAPQRRRASQ